MGSCSTYHDMRRVLLLMHTWSGYLHDVQLGIAQYLLQRPEWVWTRMLPIPYSLAALRSQNFDGIIAYVEEGYAAQLEELHLPVVDIANWAPPRRFPRVLPDDCAIGRLAAEHLMELGLHHFGVAGVMGSVFSELRQSSFTEVLHNAGFAVDCAQESQHVLPEGVQAPPGVSPTTAAWLLHLPKPAGIFGTCDVAAADILEACRHLGIRVPEEICVLGADNDDLISRFTHPPLSSIALPSQKIGFQAALLLDQLMTGCQPPERPICLPPTGVVTRQSTNLLAIPDEDVLAAVRYIREHVHKGIGVEEVLKVVPVNRRYLERKFRQYVGRTPLQEIRRTRIEKAKELLSGTDLSMPAIARHSGFATAERLANVFHEETGVTPTQYRRKFRLSDL